MIKEFKKSVGYICPHCSSINIKDINLFDFSGKSGMEFKCEDSIGCSTFSMRITPKKDRYSITIECPACGGVHAFNIKKTAFWQKRFMVLECPDTGFGIFFAGEREEINKEIMHQESILEESEDFAIDEELTSIFEAVEHINELAKDGKVYCACSSRAIAIEIDNERIMLRCRDCGLKMDIPTTPEGLDKLLNASAIVLE